MSWPLALPPGCLVRGRRGREGVRRDAVYVAAVNAKAKGSAKERQSKALLELEGWHVTKAGGSLGAADLVALKDGERPMLVQVKATAKGPFEHFGPVERAELLSVAKAAGAVPMLAWWKPRAREHRLLESYDWP